MHFCGNIFHDLPLYLAFTIPFWRTIWIHMKYFFVNRKHNKVFTCDKCHHDH